MIKEEFTKASKFEDELNILMEKYLIEDSIFVYHNSLKEVTSGYFECLNECASLTEAIKDCFGHYDTMGVRVMNNKQFMVGKICKTITECNTDNKIFDIDGLMNII